MVSLKLKERAPFGCCFLGVKPTREAKSKAHRAALQVFRIILPIDITF